MSTLPRNNLRFLPTLTEVVVLPLDGKTEPPATPDLENIIGLVMERVNLVIERRLREEFDATLRLMMTEQLQSLGIRLRQELEIVVRQAVSDALTSK